MATARAGGTSRRSSSSRSPAKGQQPEVSPARWGGIALVIAAIVGAIFLAVISPGDAEQSGQPGDEMAEVGSSEFSPSPAPSPTGVDVPVPVAAPKIIIPKDGKRTGEYEFDVTVAVPEDRTVPRKDLELHIYNNGQHAKTSERPKPGTEVKVAIRLTPGDNVLTAALGSTAGLGPESDPRTVILDETIPPLEIVSPKDKLQTYEDTVTVEVASEIGAKVTIHNRANDDDVDDEIGPGGTISKVVRLKWGKNRIVATSVDQAGLNQKHEVVVTRLDGRPTIKQIKVPEFVKPPQEIRIVAEIIDADKKPMKGADVHFTLTGPIQSTLSTTSTTNAKGRAVWMVEIPASSSAASKLELGVTVTSPTGGPPKRDSVPIEVR